MATFQQRRDPMRLMWRRLIAVGLLIVLVLAVRAVWGVYQKSQDSYVLKVEAKAKLDDLKGREAELRADIANLHSEKGVEAELRERYDVAAPGEGVVVIIDQPEPPPEPPPSKFQKIKSFFSW